MRPDQVLPEGALIRVQFELRLPAAATAEQVEQWLKYEISSVGKIGIDHPLVNHAPNIWPPTDLWLGWHGERGVREEYDHGKHVDGSTYYHVRYLRKVAT